MTPFLSARSVALAGGATALALLLAQPAQAHGIAQGGVAAGFFHPISGVDHLLLLVSVGAAGAVISPQLLLWALAGAIDCLPTTPTWRFSAKALSRSDHCSRGVHRSSRQ